MIDHRRGMYVHVRDNKTAWLLFAFVFAPFIGFFIGHIATAVAPSLANLATPLACNNGTLQTHQTSFSSGAGSVTYHLNVECLNNGVQEDVTQQVEVTDGLIFAVGTLILSSLIAGFIWSTQSGDN